MLEKKEIEFILACINAAQIQGQYIEIAASAKEKVKTMLSAKVDNRKYDDIANRKLAGNEKRI